jgi:hypothetical protein
MIVRTWYLLFLFLCGTLFPIASGNADTSILTFDTQWSTARAACVVRLTFDTKTGLSVKEILKGVNNAPAQLKFEEEEFRSKLASVLKRWDLKTPIEVIAFLHVNHEGRWNYEHSEFLFLQGDTIHGLERAEPGMTRHALLAALRETVSLQSGFNGLLTRPMTREQFDELVGFLLKHAQLGKPGRISRYQGDYFLENAKRHLGSYTPQALSWILERLLSSQAEREQNTLIELVLGFPPTDSAFEAVGGFIDRSHPLSLRRTAIRAVRSIDPYRALDLLIPYLTPDEPALTSFLWPLSGIDEPPLEIRNPVAVKPLTDMILAIRTRHLQNDPYPPATGYFLLEFLTNYNHPRHIPMLVDWATDDGDPNAGSAMQCLASISDLPGRPSRRDAKAWLLWWDHNKSVLDRDYDLSTAAGIRAWLETSEKADKDIRAILMKLWTFEPTIAEDALIEEAKKNGIARSLLAGFWSKDRLSVSARRSLVKQHLSFHLVRMPNAPDSPVGNFFSVRIAAKSNFPFPFGTIIHYRDAIALNGDPQMEPFRTSFNLDGILRAGSSTLSGFHHDGDRLNAVVQLKELDDPRRNSTLLWELEWKLEPLVLRNESN